MMDYLFRGDLNDLDPDLFELTQIEAERQYRKLIMIPSESDSPMAVREALATAYHNIYAEGYPPESTRKLTESEIFDYETRLSEYRRYSDPRYYKGVEYADIVEALARRRCAETFATNGVKPADLFVNVQALSGGPANNAVYHALVAPGDTVMGMNLLHGGHLSHGSRVNRSGKYYHIVSYAVDPITEMIDYDQVESLAREHKPKMIIAGVSSYPWALDWERFRDIADAVGAYLMADIAHVAGLIAVGIYPSPVGIADVITSTTHKTLCGPRGAIIMTINKVISRKIDRAVFPGEQGGPHVNVFAAMAIAFKLAQTNKFRELQKQVVTNCKLLADRLSARGLRLAFGGTNTHLLNIDTKSVNGEGGAWLTGDLAARILDIAGIVTNRNTIPGDKSALNPSGVRMGPTWITQRGFKETEILELADTIADILFGTTPYHQGRYLRAKVNFDVLDEARLKVRNLAEKAGIDFSPTSHGYPHFYYSDDALPEEWVGFDIRGDRVTQFLNFVVSSDIGALDLGEKSSTTIYTPMGIVEGGIEFVDNNEYRLVIPGNQAGITAAWIRDLSDGYVAVDDDLLRKIPGPVVVKSSGIVEMGISTELGEEKPYFIGISNNDKDPLPKFSWEEKETELRRTPIYDLHVSLGAKMVPFAGWEMPVRYSSVMAEHLAVREAVGIFDVAHMGVYQAEGKYSAIFLDSVCANDISSLDVGESLYTHFLTPDADVIDDLIVYRRDAEKYMLVVNASNDDKDWAWLTAVRDGKVRIDNNRPWAKAFGRKVILRNLRDPQSGKDMRVDIALQGPESRRILLSLAVDDDARKRVMSLKRTDLCEADIGGYDLVVSRTGYTGEKMAFELFVHPDRAEELFQTLLEVGEPLGIKPIGLGARDSLRTEAGLPLYGHEMGGGLNLGVSDAGFGSYIKVYKPWFIGREAYLEKESTRRSVVVRFRFDNKAVRMAHPGDPVVDKRGRMIGLVTSCAADKEGYLLGQAYVELKHSSEGKPIYIFQGAPKESAKAPADLNIGDRLPIPTKATVLSRFPK